jgi:hypothetical protein
MKLDINYKQEFFKKHNLNEIEFNRLIDPMFYKITVTNIEAMPITESNKIKESMLPYIEENDEYIESFTVSSYSSYVGEDEENESNIDDEDLMLDGSYVCYEDVDFFGMEKSSAISGINEDSEIFIIREVYTDYSGLNINYLEDNLYFNLKNRFEKSSLNLEEFLLKETIIDSYSNINISNSISELLKFYKNNFKFTIQRLSYCWIIKGE